MLFTRPRVGGVHALSIVHVTPLFVRKWPFTVSLEAPPRALPPGVAHVDGGPPVFCWWSFLLSTFLSLPVKYMFVLFPFCFSILVLMFFIAYFCPWPFQKSFFVFSIQFLNYNLSYIVFSKSVLILLICHFNARIFC